MNRFSKLATTLAVLPVLAVAGHAFADSPPQLGGGADVYGCEGGIFNQLLPAIVLGDPTEIQVGQGPVEIAANA